MVSQKLKTIFLFSIPIFLTHELEEYFLEFYNQDWLTLLFSSYFQNIPEAVFSVFNFSFILILLLIFFFIQGGRWPLRLMIIPGFIFIFEINHPIRAIATGGYTPGLITSILLLMAGFLYWRELIKNFRAA